MRQLSFVVALLLTAAFPAGSEEARFHASGVAYIEHDGRPGRGPGEPGVRDVLVSNGRDVVRTDAEGRYRLPARPGDVVFAVKPDGLRFVARPDGLPHFWFRFSPRATGGLPQSSPARPGPDFALHPAVPGPAADTQVLVFADTQVKHATDIAHYRRDIVEPLIGRHQAQFGVTLGDVVDDDLSLYPALIAETTRIGVPWFHVPGNHDLDLQAPDDAGSLETWRRVLGPDTYAVREGGTHFLLLDDVIHHGNGRYLGGLREDQFTFLRNYLAHVRRDERIVLGVHIPLFDADGRETFRRADRERLFALLKDFPHVLVLSGHSHTQRHHFHDADDGWHGAAPLHEYNVGAVSGAFWSGVKDAAGVPDATMSDGTPNGHAVLTLPRAGGYALAWHPARPRADDPAHTPAMALHAPRVLRRGAYPAYGVYANVFMGMDDTRVEYRVDGGDWKPMRRVDRPDPRVLIENVRDDLAETLRGYDRSPEARPSAHLWRGTLPTDIAVGEHRVDVRAFDRWQGEQRASITYRLDAVETP